MSAQPRWRRPLTLGVSALALTGAGVGLRSAKDIPAGTGYSALELCTRTMQSGEDFEHVRRDYVEPKVRPLPDIWRIENVPGVRVTVSTRLPLFEHPRPAVFRRGLGCTIAPPGVSEATLRAQRFRPAPELAPDPRPWPQGEGAIEAQLLSPAGRAVVERHAQILFSEPSAELKQHRNTNALLVAHRGHLLFERYGRGYARDQPQLGWSMTKTLTALIAGTLAQDGKLALDGEVGLARWKGTPRQAITWRALLNMSPGLQWDEGYGGASDATEMLFSHADEGAWAADRPQTSKPGTVFTYSTGFSNLAMRRMRELLGGSHQAIYDHYQSRLFRPLGIRGGVIEPDASGTPVGGARGLLRPVDWLRLGQLVANGGRWNERTIVPPEWIAFMLAASPAAAEYGGSIWRQASPRIAAPLRSRLPTDLVFFAGHLGQFTVVVPSRQLVVVRMGVSQGTSMDHDGSLELTLALVADLLDALG